MRLMLRRHERMRQNRSVIAGSALILEARDATITLARAAAVDDDPATTAAPSPGRSRAGGPDRAVARARPVSSGRGCLAVLKEAAGRRGPRLRGSPGSSPSPSGSDEPIEADFAARLRRGWSAIGEDGFRREWQRSAAFRPSPCAPRSKPCSRLWFRRTSPGIDRADLTRRDRAVPLLGSPGEGRGL